MWPTTTCAIRPRDILPDEADGDDECMPVEIDNTNNAEGDEDIFESIPEQATFNCLCDIDSLQVAFNILNVVILEEYAFLRQLLENSDRPFIVTVLLREAAVLSNYTSHDFAFINQARQYFCFSTALSVNFPQPSSFHPMSMSLSLPAACMFAR